MKSLPFLIAGVFLIAALAGCTDQPSDMTPADTTGSPTQAQSFEFNGDFSGPLGLQLWSIREAMQDDVPGTLEWVRQSGFEEVELAGTYEMTAEAFRQELDRAGLRATAMHVPYEMLRDSLDVALDRAEVLGVDYVGIAWIPHPEDEPFTPEMARETAARFNEWGSAANERGLQFFYHNHGYEFEPAADGTIPFDVLVEETDPENVKYEMDVFWTYHPGVDPAELLRKYPDRWELMHIKDMRQGTPTGDFSGHAPAEAQVPIGSGQIDYAAVLQAAEEIGLDRYYIEDETTDPMGNIPVSIEYLESVEFGAAP